jgi:prepilin-type N-terminal cleavage/methylation domain-containing protein
MKALQLYLQNPKTRAALAKRPGDEGFSLIELVVVVAVLAIISAIAIPAFTDTSRKAATASAKQSLASFYGQCGAERANEGAWTSTEKEMTINGYTSKAFKCSDTSWKYESKDTKKNPTLEITLATGKKDCTATDKSDASADCPW